MSFKRLRDPSDLGEGGECCVCFCFLFGWLGLWFALVCCFGFFKNVVTGAIKHLSKHSKTCAFGCRAELSLRIRKTLAEFHTHIAISFLILMMN